MTKTALIMGLPGAGKTTFLAALWHVVRSGKVPGALSAVVLPQERKYLNLIADIWERCGEQEHTNAGMEAVFTLLLEDPKTKDRVELGFPDLDGESFQSHWSDRQWNLLYNDLALEASGGLMFIHPDHAHDAPLLADEIALADTLDELGEVCEGTAEDEGGPPASDEKVEEKPETGAALSTPYDDDFAPKQVKLVEALQFLTSGPVFHSSFPLSLVVSAWDRVRSMGWQSGPEEWLARHLPLLDQFLRSNSDVFAPEFFGISATGGDLEKDKERLLDHVEPFERIEVVDRRGRPVATQHDITLASAPIRLQIDLDPAFVSICR